MAEKNQTMKNQDDISEPQVIAQFSPSKVKNLVATCGENYTFYLTESSVVFRINETFKTPRDIKSPVEYVLSIPREITTGAIFLTANCDASRILILTKTSIFLYKFNPKSKFHEVEMLNSIELTFQPPNQKVADVCFFEYDPNYFAIAYNNGIIQFINCTTGCADDEINIDDKIASIKFGPNLKNNYLHLALFIFTGSRSIYVINPILTPGFQISKNFVDRINDIRMKKLLENIRNNGLYDFFIPPPVKIALNTRIISFDFLEDYFAFVIQPENSMQKSKKNIVAFVQNEIEPKLVPITKPEDKDFELNVEDEAKRRKAEEVKVHEEEIKKRQAETQLKKIRAGMTLQSRSLLITSKQNHFISSTETPGAIIRWEENIMKIDITDSVIAIPLGTNHKNFTFMRNPGLIALAPNMAVFIWGNWKENPDQNHRSLISAGGRVAFYGTNAIGYGGDLCLLAPGYVVQTTRFENGSTRINPDRDSPQDGWKHDYEDKGPKSRSKIVMEVRECTESFQKNKKLIEELNAAAKEREQLHKKIGADQDVLRWDDLLVKAKELRKQLMRMRTRLRAPQ